MEDQARIGGHALQRIDGACRFDRHGQLFSSNLECVHTVCTWILHFYSKVAA